MTPLEIVEPILEVIFKDMETESIYESERVIEEVLQGFEV